MQHGLERMTLGRTGLEVTAIGFGAAPIGNLFEDLPEPQVEATLERAWNAGLRFFDTAPYYGFGLSELRVGRLLRSKPRGEFVLSTKVGRHMVPPGTDWTRGQWAAPLRFQPVYDYSYDGTMRALEQSRMRLGVPEIDIALIHDVDRWTHGDEYERRFGEAMAGAYKALEELRRSGDVKAIGVGLNESACCARFAEAGDFDCMILAGRYTLLEQGALDDFLPLAARRNIAVIIAGAFNSGILAAGPRAGAPYDYKAASPDIIGRVRRLDTLCDAAGVPLPAAALQFVRAHPAVAAVLVGMVRPEEVERNLALLRHPIPTDLWQSLKEEGLLRPEAPVPG